MILLVLGFEYDTTSRVIITQPETSRGLQVLGILTPVITADSADGGMVREFHKHSKEPVRLSDLEDFRVNMAMAFRAALSGGRLDPIWDRWLSDIDPYVEDSTSGHPCIKLGTSIRFYHPDGPENSWVWKDSVKMMTVIYKP